MGVAEKRIFTGGAKHVATAGVIIRHLPVYFDLHRLSVHSHTNVPPEKPMPAGVTPPSTAG
ncbi:hypothetical protein [Rhizobium wenxiniae]|uniref:hypothetical protein n=1 Tax=Rhizobium wenxiniae TaxID=1737357 RepID=UPI001C6E9980